MLIEIGDLVECRMHRRIGVVVDRRPCVEGLSASTHTNHILDSYPSIYYILFQDTNKKEGPYFTEDLFVKQRRCDTLQ